MTINKKQLTELTIDTLNDIELYSENALAISLGTCAQESRMGTYIKQLEEGPALGIHEMERGTYESLWKHFLSRKSNLVRKISDCLGLESLDNNIAYKLLSHKSEMLVYNLKLSIIMCRVQYVQFEEPLPDRSDIPSMAAYWKKYYNTWGGKGTEEEFIENYHRYVIRG